MALGNNSGGHTYLNIKEGKIVFKNKATGEKELVDFVSGKITAVKFETKEWEGNSYEQASFTIVDGEDKYILQMHTDSGYFRAMCNQMKTGNPEGKFKFTPNFTAEGGKKRSGMFVEQAGNTLKWYSKKDDMKDVPPSKAVTVKGKTIYDNTDQIEYWKKWLGSITWQSELEAGAEEATPVQQKPAVVEADEDLATDNEGDDDLPF